MYPSDRTLALRATALSVVCVCLLIVALDLAFRADLPTGYLRAYTDPLWPRTAWSCLDSVGEELVYRLGLMTALAAVPALIRRRAGPGWIVAAIVLAQLVNTGPLVFVVPPWGMLRFWLVGCVWGWLYWRHGFFSALIGHGVAHILLDPVLLAVLA
ncbi:MAG: type II CAAX prenyl endopeptidase Rce1 family protein [Novosphingobium sp.]